MSLSLALAPAHHRLIAMIQHLISVVSVLGLVMGVVMPALEQPSLAEVYRPFFPIGMGVDRADLDDPAVWALVRRQASAVTVENALKPGLTQPREGRFTFERGDRVVDAARAAGLSVHGHTLVWHRQTPDWFFEDDDGQPASRERVLERLRTHIATVAGHYRGRVWAWDVVNEALADGGGKEDLRDSAWHQALGFDYLVEAFRAAAAADPEALLFYNDYNLETEPKRSRALRLIARLREAGVRVDGIGMQTHINIDRPAISEIEASIVAFAEAGLLVHISELDVSLHPWRTGELQPEDLIYADGLPDAVQERLARRYAELFACFLRHRESLCRVTFWNTHDGRSWLNNEPIRGRVDHPLLFDRQLQPKPAFDHVLAQARPPVVITAFAPFAGRGANGSQTVAAALDGQVIAGHRIQTRVLAVRWGEPERVLPELVAEAPVALLLGLGEGHPGRIAIETTAHNRAQGADEAGAPAPATLSADDPGPRQARLIPLSTVPGADPWPVVTSHDAGSYLCNAWLWHASALAVDRVGFIHLPPQGGKEGDDYTAAILPALRKIIAAQVGR